MYVIQIEALAGAVIHSEWPQDGRPAYVRRFDPDANGGLGEVIWTQDVRLAWRFRDQVEAMEYWRQPSTVLPLRPDGKPNRPLTAYSISVIPVDAI